MQLVTSRATAAKIADEYLQDKGVKLRYRSARTSMIRDPNAYRRGVKDGKKIDIHRKRIENDMSTACHEQRGRIDALLTPSKQTR